MADPVKIRVASWNVHALPGIFGHGIETRMRAIASRLAQADPVPSVVALQEVWSVRTAANLAASLRPRGFRLAVPPGRDCGFGTGGLLLLYRPDQWSLVGEPGFHEYAHRGPRAKVWEGDGIAHKGVIVARFRDATGRELTLLNTHLQSQYDLACEPAGRAYTEVRQGQLTELSEVAASLGDKQPVLLVGDFNTFPQELGRELQFQGWTDLTEPNRRDCPKCRTFLEKRGTPKCAAPSKPRVSDDGGGWFDYAFIRANGATAISRVTLLSNTGIDDPYSDHNGLLIDVSLTMPSTISRVSPMTGRAAALAGIRQPTTRREWLYWTACMYVCR